MEKPQKNAQSAIIRWARALALALVLHQPCSQMEAGEKGGWEWSRVMLSGEMFMAEEAGIIPNDS